MRAVVIGLVGLWSLGLPALAQPQGGRGKPILYTTCRQGQCVQTQVLSVRLEQQTPQGRLYRVTVGQRTWMEDKSPPASFQTRRQEYAYCSRTRPAYIFGNPGNYTAHLLDPVNGPRAMSHYASYVLYWGVCHGVTDPDTPALAEKAIQLGYSPKLPEGQITLARPQDILKR
ncbi:MAG: hypothetical protein RMI89_02820 [Gloeomargarita sp. SKYBB_i_bin120]|nr:hypothetical protein [Gloeomargarita sp. SKYG98]MCS7291893.1 hypothetical protein [Gloeomargarita sp. SKYB120]MDW8177453.1 hypothetical protein [Gloeomargarita sp. SKYBB_i_bin120]